jgi:hypothetical protein
MYLFRLDNSTHEGQPLEMFSGTSTHRVEIDLPGSNLSNKPSIEPKRTYDIRHFVDDFQTGTLAILFASLCIGVDNFIMELAHGLLQPTMALRNKNKWCYHDAREATTSIPPCNRGYGSPPLAR